MDRVRAELDRVKASKAAMAQERSRVAAATLHGEAMEMEELRWRDQEQYTKKVGQHHQKQGLLDPSSSSSSSHAPTAYTLAGSSTVSPMGSHTDDGNSHDHDSASDTPLDAMDAPSGGGGNNLNGGGG
eukprot:CAMPEP_0197592240 /NCGR_PEP_ID=MMETSP1326-20131121/14984_1 /TAXON_ID=1155430 /ORGANISM="Genus nov. species nov., Strain RCC2288" /LENGTH=127 /DNA_ID=CAMNT_0043157917 /DNA_START=234 /DNA_END=614 /DNA_ORIENTATION=+